MKTEKDPPNASTVPAIEVENVGKRFGDVTALDEVSFRVMPGELFFLLGPSGCGKTTMLRILAGLETQDTGKVLLRGRDMAGLDPHLRGAPLVFQNYALWPHLSVHDNVAFGLVERRVPRREIRARVEEALDRVDLEGLGGRMPGQLSGGQQQRVVLARALVLNPDVVLLDEPLSNLDAKLRGEMRDEIARLHGETGITFVYVTHDQAEALALADRLVVMHEGRITASGRPLDLYHRPPNFFCADFLGESNVLDGSVVESDGPSVRVETSFGAWMGVSPGDTAFEKGAAIKCVIRPESLRPVEAGAGGNTLEATVRALRMNGSTVTAVLDSAAGTLRAAVLNRYPLGLEVGRRLEWSADPENTVILAE